MAFTAQDVKTLREMTGCGMMDCKKALTETDGDMDKAVEYLREKGLATGSQEGRPHCSRGRGHTHPFDPECEASAQLLKSTARPTSVAKSELCRRFR